VTKTRKHIFPNFTINLKKKLNTEKTITTLEIQSKIQDHNLEKKKWKSVILFAKKFKDQLSRHFAPMD